jgi:hypothetical protein
MISNFFTWLFAHGVSATGVGTAIAFVVSVFKFLSVRKRESQEREYDKYHVIIRRIVAPDEKDAFPFLDRQIAAVFELRHFPRYYECTERILLGLKQSWPNEKGTERLIQEIDLTLKYIKKRK